MSKINKKIGGGILTLVLLFSFTLTAFAGVSNTKYETVNNIDYYFYSSAYTGSGRVWGGTTVGTVNRSNVPAGWLGVQPKLYNSRGDIEDVGRWLYSERSCAELYSRTDELSGKGTYLAAGNVRMYNSRGTYDTFSTMKTPYVTLSSELENIEITKNNAGEIYGSEYFLNQIGIQPDLISAIGDNGIAGYVKDSDLNNDITPKSPVEAVNGENNDYSIPLYDKEGLTVIGTFTIKAVTGEYR